MKSHKLPASIKNSEAEFFIAEFVRYPQHQKMLRDWWFSQITIQQIAEKYNYSTTHTKEILYKYSNEFRKLMSEKIQND